MNIRTALIGTIVFAAVSIPVANAQSPDDRAGMRGPGAFESTQVQPSIRPDDRAGLKGPGAVEPAQQSKTIRPDDRVGARGPGAFDSAQSQSTRPDDRSGARGPGAVDSAVVVRQVSSGFDWGDAFIGALGGLGTGLALTGILFLLVGRRGRTRIA